MNLLSKSLSPLLCIAVACGGSISPEQEPQEQSPDAGSALVAPDFEGFAIAPPNENYKDKTSFKQKLESLVARGESPSVLSGAFVQLTRSYLSGRQAESQLERVVFASLGQLSPETRYAFARVVDGVDGLPLATRSKIYDQRFTNAAASTVLTRSQLAAAVDYEMRARLSLELYGTADAEECLENERPGIRRTLSCRDIEGNYDSSCNHICEIGAPGLVQGLRTSTYTPRLSGGDYLPREVESRCSLDANQEFSCTTVSAPACSGIMGEGGACLAIPTARQGEAVTFRGFNFFSVDARIKLRLAGTPDVRELPAHVCGDVGRAASAPADCDVNDLVTFTIPQDLAAGRYQVEVVVPDSEGIDFYTDMRGKPLLEVLPAATGRFELIAQELNCVKETSPAYFGSDEIGLSIMATQVASDGVVGPLERVDFRLDDVDSGEHRELEERSFAGGVEGALAISVLGFEIDGDQAFKDQVQGFEEAFAAVTASIYGEITAGLSASGGTLLGIGVGSAAIGTAVAAIVAVASVSVLALWLPADLVIEDTDGFSERELSRRTSLNFPLPLPQASTSQGGVQRVVEACEADADTCESAAKTTGQYRERRSYKQPDESSHYDLILRYRRTP